MNTAELPGRERLQAGESFWTALLRGRRRLILIIVLAIAVHLVGLSIVVARNSPFTAGPPTVPWPLPGAPIAWMIGSWIIGYLCALAAAVRLQFRVSPRFTHLAVCFAVTVPGITYVALLRWATPDARVFIVDGLIHTLLLGHVFNLVPVRYLLVVSALVTGSFSAVALSASGPWPASEALFNVQLLVSFNIVLLAAAYLLEKQARLNHELLQAIDREQRLGEAQSRQRAEWLSFGAHFLRHELRNALIGVSSSLMLMRRRIGEGDDAELIGRAEHSSRRMRTLLDEAGTATAAETRFLDVAVREFDLSEVVTEAIEEVCQDLPAGWQLDVPSTLSVTGARDLVLGGLERCLRYLVRVTQDKGTVRIRVDASGERVSLEFLYDEPNPADTLLEARFDSREPDRSPHFDLFVARRAFEAAGGALRVLRCDDGAARGLSIRLGQSQAPSAP